MRRYRLAAILFASVIATLCACSGEDDRGTTDGGGTDDGTTPPPSRVVFVSSVKYTGALGGVADADSTCQALASAAGLSGTFKAWLSDSVSSAGERLSHSPDPYVRTDGVQVAADWADLVSPPLANAINVDEHGVELPPDGNFSSTAYVWTGTLPDARSVGPWNCDEWTSSGGREFKDNAIAGKANEPSQWTTVWASGGEAATFGCEYEFRLYCFEQ